MDKISIATLNLNGEARSLNGKLPNLPQTVLDRKAIIENLDKTLKNGLSDLLKKKGYDIIALQELPYFNGGKKLVKDIAELQNYELIFPKIKDTVHHTVAFLVKKNLRESILIDCLLDDNNRSLVIRFIKDKFDITLINLHLGTGSYVDSKYVENIIQCLPTKKRTFILLGDFNDYNASQSTKKNERKDNIIDKIRKEDFIEVGEDYDFTYLLGDRNKNKLDHIFISNKNYNKEKVDAGIVTEVNFRENHDNGNNTGFTDHSLLYFTFPSE